MRCPFCNNDMKKGFLTGDGRSKVYWNEENKKIALFDKFLGKGLVDAKYNFYKFEIESYYCSKCKKMIFETDIAN